MSDRDLSRRRVVRATGAALLAGLAGCSSDAPGDETGTADPTTDAPTDTATATPTATTAAGNETTGSDTTEGVAGPREGDDLPPDPVHDDGYPPEFDSQPSDRLVDTSEYETLTRETPEGESVDVKLIPIEDAYYWYARGEARFVDARSETGYEVAHIFGAVLSPAPDGRAVDPTTDWNKDDTVVTYCHCPHHLSSLRAAEMIEAGFTDVYAIDEGFQAWLDRNYPLAGDDTNRDYTVRTVEGTTNAADAGETAWAVHPPTDQVEATEIAADGSYSLELKFVDVDADSTILVETPSYAIEASLETVTSGTVTAETGRPASPVASGNSTATGNGTATPVGNATVDGTGSNVTTDDGFSLSFLRR